MNLTVISSILSSVGILIGNPLLGVLPAKIVPLLNLVSELVLKGSEALDKLDALDAQLKAIIAEGRPPSEEEWAEWEARHEAAKARLQS
jgi:hypothetical protein